MNMKSFLLPALIGTCALTCTLPLPAAQQAPNYAAAKALVADDGYIIFAYADGWDKFSQKRCQKLIEHSAILKAAGNAVLMPLPIPEYTTEETKKAMEEHCGELKVPGANSYPALIFMDAKGKHYATLYGKDVTRGKVSRVAEMVADTLEKGKKRRDLLRRAEAAPGPEKARLTFEAYQIDGLTWYGKGFSEHIAKLDPQDASGANHAAKYNHYGLLDTLNKEPIDKGLAEVDKMLADPAYTPVQKQQMCVAAVGMLRRRAGATGAADMQRYAELMKKLAPGTAEGKAADRILRDWVRPLSYEEGWTPGTLPMDATPVELVGKLPIAEPGTYTVRFDYTRGRHALNILAVELYDGNTKVAEDRHKGTTGNKSQNNTYTLKVNAPVKSPHLFISVDMPRNRDSNGTITIERH